MPSNLPTESEKAKEGGIELVGIDDLGTQKHELERKLKSEDKRNVFGGFPTSVEQAFSLVETLKEEWLAAGASPESIHIVVHESCVNGHDCITVVNNGGKKYHYNTKMIIGYRRNKLISFLKRKHIAFSEDF
jgi:adenylate kinase family enzyme